MFLIVHIHNGSLTKSSVFLFFFDCSHVFYNKIPVIPCHRPCLFHTVQLNDFPICPCKCLCYAAPFLDSVRTFFAVMFRSTTASLSQYTYRARDRMRHIKHQMNTINGRYHDQTIETKLKLQTKILATKILDSTSIRGLFFLFTLQCLLSHTNNSLYDENNACAHFIRNKNRQYYTL